MSDNRIIFIGIADHIVEGETPPPVGTVDTLNLSCYRNSFLFPLDISSMSIVFAMKASLLLGSNGLYLSMKDNDGVTIAEIGVSSESGPDVTLKSEVQNMASSSFIIKKGWDEQYALFSVSVDARIVAPGEYRFFLGKGSAESCIGACFFEYAKAPALTRTEIRAIESNPKSVKGAHFVLGCPKCPSVYKVYTGIDKSPKLEGDGYIWYENIDDEFVCGCGNTRMSLKYLKESAHGVLRLDELALSAVEYTRRYSHVQVKKVLKQYFSVLDVAQNENDVQRFLESNRMIFAQFKAKRIFDKISVLGKYETDFVVLDVTGRLIFIEIESPSMQILKRDGHATSKLMHAYSQVNDWVREFNSNPNPILERMNLDPAEVPSVRGVVIAGRQGNVDARALSLFRLSPPYPGIDFFTFDELGLSLEQISRQLA